MVRRDYTLDDCAAYDYPVAINKVIEVTKQVQTPYPVGGDSHIIKDKGACHYFVGIALSVFHP